MEDSFLKIKYDKLIYELKFLEADLQYHDSILQKGAPQFEAKCREAIEDLGLGKFFYGQGSPAQESAKQQAIEKKEKPKTKASKPVEALFKKIAAKTHPDKLLDLEEDEREKKQQMFLRATKAKEEDNLMAMHIIASELNVDIPDISFEDIMLFEKKVVALKQQIEDKKSTWMWAWLVSSPEKRENIVTNYVDFMVKTVLGTQKKTEE